MDEFQAGLAIFLRAVSDRDNFTELENLWLVGNSKPFHRAIMSLNRFKCFLRCIPFDNWHAREQKKVDVKFPAGWQKRNIFSSKCQTCLRSRRLHNSRRAAGRIEVEFLGERTCHPSLGNMD